jgi:hypothetical protein
VEEEYGYREAGAHSTTPTSTVSRGGPAREPRWSAFWLQMMMMMSFFICSRRNKNQTKDTYPKGTSS